jgi:large repetitive protein
LHDHGKHDFDSGLGRSGPNPDAKGNFSSSGYNLIGKKDGSTGFTNGVNQDQVGTIAAPIDPLLGPLSWNGGLTQTHSLLLGSPAMDKGFSALASDQRGAARYDDPAVANATGGDGSDIGSYERNPTTPVAVQPVARLGIHLARPNPNPLTERTVIDYSLPTGADVQLAVFDARGRWVQTLVSGNQSAGTHRFVWNAVDSSGRRVASGIYFIVLKTADARATQRLVVVR